MTVAQAEAEIRVWHYWRARRLYWYVEAPGDVSIPPPIGSHRWKAQIRGMAHGSSFVLLEVRWFRTRTAALRALVVAARERR